MKVFPLLLAAASAGALSTSQQAPFDTEEKERTLDWDHAPSPDATGNLIFNSVSSALQRWPNTIKRPAMSFLIHQRIDIDFAAGHSLIPATMPAGTILYHGRGNADVPLEPQWVRMLYILFGTTV